MPEHRSSGGPSEAYDRELSLRGIIWTGVGLALLLVISAILMWPLATGLRERGEAADPPPPVLPEARRQPLPPEPRLQARPEEDMRAMRAEESRLLETWQWLDAERATARVPVERAMEILSEQGLDGAAAAEGAGGEPR